MAFQFMQSLIDQTQIDDENDSETIEITENDNESDIEVDLEPFHTDFDGLKLYWFFQYFLFSFNFPQLKKKTNIIMWHMCIFYKM